MIFFFNFMFSNSLKLNLKFTSLVNQVLYQLSFEVSIVLNMLVFAVLFFHKIVPEFFTDLLGFFLDRYDSNTVFVIITLVCSGNWQIMHKLNHIIKGENGHHISNPISLSNFLNLRQTVFAPCR